MTASAIQAGAPPTALSAGTKNDACCRNYGFQRRVSGQLDGPAQVGNDSRGGFDCGGGRLACALVQTASTIRPTLSQGSPFAIDQHGQGKPGDNFARRQIRGARGQRWRARVFGCVRSRPPAMFRLCNRLRRDISASLFRRMGTTFITWSMKKIVHWELLIRFPC